MTDTIEIVAALIRDAAGRVLLVRKRGTTAFMQPGGKRDCGEDDITALAREIDEELGCGLVSDSIRSLGEFDAISANEPGFRVRAALYEVEVTGEIAPKGRDRGDDVGRSSGTCRHRAGAADPRSCIAAGVTEACRRPRLNRISATLHQVVAPLIFGEPDELRSRLDALVGQNRW